jgi:hypothetical protein
MQRRHAAGRKAVLRALVGQGVDARESPVGEDWDVVNLPLGGRMKVTTAMRDDKRRNVLHWVKTHAERRHWGALVWLAVGGRWGTHPEVYAQVQLDDLAMILGRLSWLERERRRWLDSAPDSVDAGDGRR